MFYNTYVSKYVLVATLTNIPNLLVYKLKEKHIQNAHVGKIVLVPIKSRYYKGVITELFEELPENCKNFEIEEIYDMPPLPQLFDEQLLQFYKFAANLLLFHYLNYHSMNGTELSYLRHLGG